jgi:hypothetical protein
VAMAAPAVWAVAVTLRVRAVSGMGTGAMVATSSPQTAVGVPLQPYVDWRAFKY